VQPTEIQVQESIRALERRTSIVDAVGDADGEGVPPGLVEFLLQSPGERLEHMAAARRRLAAGEQPSDDDLAERLVGRLVCDRLR
jgi:hypothetical protein